MKMALIIERPIMGKFYRWRLQWSEPDVVNHRRIKRLFLGRMFKRKSQAGFEAVVFKQDVLEKFNFIIPIPTSK